MVDKRGQGLSVNAIILIVLGVVVLVVLILGFTLGWNRIVPFLFKNNVQNIVTACDTACSTGATYDFCSVGRELKDDEGNKIKTTCNVFSNIQQFLDKYDVGKCSALCISKKKCKDIEVVINGRPYNGELTVSLDSVVNNKDNFKTGKPATEVTVGTKADAPCNDKYLDITSVAKEADVGGENQQILLDEQPTGVKLVDETDAKENVYCCLFQGQWKA